jgi:tRNA A-37 threonylcarbamoyl transferase component Bud32
MPGKVPEPLGFDTWTYRSSPVCGWTLNASSPFIELAYEDALALDVNTERLTKHTQGVLAVCELLEQFHAKGIAHGDLTFHNAMLYLEGNRIQPILIDLASSVRLGEISAQD